MRIAARAVHPARLEHEEPHRDEYKRAVDISGEGRNAECYLEDRSERGMETEPVRQQKSCFNGNDIRDDGEERDEKIVTALLRHACVLVDVNWLDKYIEKGEGYQENQMKRRCQTP